MRLTLKTLFLAALMLAGALGASTLATAPASAGVIVHD